MKQQRPRWSGPLGCPPEQGFFGLLKDVEPTREDHLEGDARWAPDNRRSNVGRRRVGLARWQRAARPGRRQDGAHARADGGDCLADLGAVRDQQALFGAVASGATAFRLIDRIASDPDGLERLRAAHARARERAWKLI